MPNPFAFLSGNNAGFVPDPLASPATDYLAADATWKAIPVPSAGVNLAWILADPNFALGSSFERVNYQSGGLGLIQIKPQRQWTETIADAKTNVPGGWTLANSAKVNAADENTTLANALFISGVTTSTYNWDAAATQTAPYYYKVYANGPSRMSFVARIAASTLTNNSDALEFMLCDDGVIAKHTGLYIDGTPQLVGTNSTTSTTQAITAGEASNGVWVRIDFYADANVAILSYNLTNQATPPTTWTFLRREVSVLSAIGDGFRVGFLVIRATNGTADGLVKYFDDSNDSNPFGNFILPANPSFATGFDNSSPVLTLIASADIGTGATLTDANVRNAVTEIENQRFFDSATWTYSAVRGAAPNPGAGAFQAKGAITVGGAGRYFALYAKCLSTGRSQQGSLRSGNLRIPFVP